MKQEQTTAAEGCTLHPSRDFHPKSLQPNHAYLDGRAQGRSCDIVMAGAWPSACLPAPIAQPLLVNGLGLAAWSLMRMVSRALGSAWGGLSAAFLCLGS